MNPLAITGMGVVSPIAVGRTAWEQALADVEAARARAFGQRPTVLGADVVGQACAAEVWGFEPSEYLGKKGLRNFDRLTTFMIVAAKHALEDAGLKRDGELVSLAPSRVGICSATAYGSLDAITELQRVSELEDPRYINPARFPNTVINAAAGYVSIWEDLRAPNTTVVDGNCGALDAVLSCATHLHHRRGDAFLVGGGEVLSEPLFLALQKLGVLSCESDPVAEGSGLHMGEGAAYLVAERVDEAKERGARLLGVLRGYGTAFDPPESEARLAHGSADAVRRAIASALRDSGIAAEQVDAVVGARGGVAELDAAEAEGVASVLGESVAVAAPKRIYGETFGAAGALGLAHALAWLGGAPVAPRVSGREPTRLNTVVVLAVGFYGNVSAVVLTRA